MDGNVQTLAYLIIPMALILVLAGIFVGLCSKTVMVNLQDATCGYGKPEECAMGIGIYPQEEPVTAWVYKVGRLDQAACEQFGTQFAQKSRIFRRRYLLL